MPAIREIIGWMWERLRLSVMDSSPGLETRNCGEAVKLARPFRSAPADACQEKSNCAQSPERYESVPGDCVGLTHACVAPGLPAQQVSKPIRQTERLGFFASLPIR